MTAGPPRAGFAALAFIALLVAGAGVGLFLEAMRAPQALLAAPDAYLLRIVRFTLWQALLSTVLSVVPAIFVARALAGHPTFPGRALVLRLFALPLALPPLVAALGILALFGRSGLIADLYAALGGGRRPGIYGLAGILVAHTFFNLPLATRFLLQALDTVPADQWRLASQLGMNARARFRFIEWPAIRASLGGVAGIVFMLCVTSFTIVLVLGGGPAATTLEVAIYQALRFDFDPARALVLTGLQLALTGFALYLLFRLGADLTAEANPSVSARRFSAPGTGERLANLCLIALAAIYVAAPLAAVLVAGLRADLPRLAGEAAVHRAAATSLVLAVCAAVLCLMLTYALVRTRHGLAGRRGSGSASLAERAMDQGASLVLVVPPIVLGAGWFILLRHFADAFAIAPIMVITVNAVMAMPFALRALRPAYDAAAERHDRLCANLGITGFTRLRLIDWPALRRPFLTAFAFAMALSLGDLGVIALFGSDQVQTLPYLLFARLGSYRTADAAGLALVLAVLCFALMLLADQRGRTST
ncbi:MAG: thiamine/thiamine pyrophosphate ABC transporter permease [Nitratireductor sp.]